MIIGDKHLRTVWLKENDDRILMIIDQRKLPFVVEIAELKTTKEIADSIREMWVRGSELIGAVASFGVYFAAIELERINPSQFLSELQKVGAMLMSTRPTAVNLFWAVENQLRLAKELLISGKNISEIVLELKLAAQAVSDKTVTSCQEIGKHGVKLIEDIYAKKKSVVNILTHCNAGWLACVDWGMATAPIYEAKRRGIPIHVWVDETRPRNQGARLTAFELGQEGVSHTIIPDNTGGILMQRKRVDMVIVGTDRTTYTGDVANKIGTYLKALAAFDNQIPFYVALTSASIDWETADGEQIEIEERSSREISHIEGVNQDGQIQEIRIIPENSSTLNLGFDVTPRRLVSALITERGVCSASSEGVFSLFPEKKRS